MEPPTTGSRATQARPVVLAVATAVVLLLLSLAPALGTIGPGSMR